MARFEEEVLIKINVAKKQAEKAFKEINTNLAKLGPNLTKTGKSLSLKLTAPLLLLGGAAAKTAIDFESAFTGVRKTVEATEEEFAALKNGFMELAREIPVTTEELFGVGEAAGQLGIAKDDILAFTKVMADLGATTNLTAGEAATSLARLANITGLAAADYENLGSTIVELGNNMATTEAEIVEMGLRLAGTGTQVGLTEAQILSFAGALSSIGIRAESGGTAFSRAMIEINKAVGSAGKEIELFAQISGQSVEKFEKQWKENAADAFVSFIEGLSSVGEAGGNVNVMLDELGLSSIRVQDALIRASGAGDKFRKALTLGNKAWKDNVALTKEANLRYETSKSKLIIAKNKATQLAAEFGEVLVPAILKVVEELEPLIDTLKSFDEDTKTAIVSVGGIAAALGPLLIVAGGAAQVIDTLSKGWIVFAVATKFAAAAAAIVIGYKLGEVLLEWAEDADKLTESINNLTPVTDEYSAALNENMQKLANQASMLEQNRIAIAKNKQTWDEATQEVNQNTEAVTKNIEKIDELIEEYKEAGQTAFESIEKQRQSFLKLAQDIPKYKNAVNDIFDEMRLKAAKETFDILDVEEFDQQARNIVEGFKEITGGYDLTMGELEALTQKAFDQIKEAARSGELPIGFDINKIEENVNEAMSKLKEGMQRTTVSIKEEGNKTTLILKGQTLTVKEAVANTIVALNEILITSVTEESRALSAREEAIQNFALFREAVEISTTEFLKEEWATQNKTFTQAIDFQISELNRFVDARQLAMTSLPGLGSITPAAEPGTFGGYTGQFKNGVDFVPRDMLAFVHKGEKITPASQNDNRSFDNSRKVEVVMHNSFFGDSGFDQANTLRQMLETEGAL